VLLAPVVANRLNLPLPSWLPNWTAQPVTQQEGERFGTDKIQPEEETGANDALAEAWPTPPKDIMASSGNVTPISARATALPATTRAPYPTPTQVVLPTPAWRKMNYLTTVKFTASTVVEAERSTEISLLGDITTDRLLLKAVGEVSVGVDLSRISNVKIDGTAIRLKMPPPEVMGVELLPKESQIYSKSSTLFLSQYEGLESEALEQARQQLRIEVAKNVGLIDLTKKTSRIQLAEFLESVGYQNIEIE